MRVVFRPRLLCDTAETVCMAAPCRAELPAPKRSRATACGYACWWAHEFYVGPLILDAACACGAVCERGAGSAEWIPTEMRESGG